MSIRLTCLVLVAAAVVSSGCMAPRRSQYDTSLALSAPKQSPEANHYWSTAQRVLRRNRLALDRVDRRAGKITTLPVISQNIFEFWRHDVDTREDLWEATINPIRRWAEVRIAQDADGNWQRLTMIVHKERLSSPDRQFNSTAAAYRLFSATLPTTSGQTRTPSGDERWLDMGVDEAMAAYLLEQIVATTDAPGA
ncbi:MAG: hypothetical protein ACE5E5_01525 [Phycisphaerae bacterium]